VFHISHSQRISIGFTNVSLNQFIVVALAEKVSALKTAAFFQERAARADQEKTLSILDSVKKVPPIPGDELPL
jgi:hypothetical protein